MTSTKELFAPAINYILRDIKDNTDAYNNGLEYLNKVQSKQNNKPLLIAQIKSDLYSIKCNIKKHKAELKYYTEYFGYTEQDFINLKVHPATDEEIKADYENDLKEVEYDKTSGRGKYTKQEHDELVKRVNEFNKLNDLPCVAW